MGRLPKIRLVVAVLAILGIGFTSHQCAGNPLQDRDWPRIEKVDRQPAVSALERLVSALDLVGCPLSKEQLEKVEAIKKMEDDANVVASIQELLNPICLAAVHINPEIRVKVIQGPSSKELVENGWRTFLVKVHNEAGINPPLSVSSPQDKPQFVQSDSSAEPKEKITLADVKDRWLNVEIANRRPMNKTLSGLELEYQISEPFNDLS